MAEEQQKQQKQKRVRGTATAWASAALPVQPGKKEADFEEAVALAGYGPYNYVLLFSGVFSALSHQANTVMLAYLLPAAECDLQLTAVRKGILAATPYAGMLGSALLWGFLSDTLGRRRLLLVAYVMDACINILSSLAPSYWLLLLLRFGGGFVICGPMSIQKTYLSEFHGASRRPRVMMWTGVFVAGANVFFPALAYALLPVPIAWTVFRGFTFTAWRLFVAVSALPSLAAFAILLFFGESPKYLLSSGHGDEALQVLRRMFRWNTGQEPKLYPVGKLRAESRPAVLTTDASLKKPLTLLRLGWLQLRPLLLRPHRPRAVLVLAIQFWTLLGMNTLRLWLPQLFSSIEEYHHQNSLNNQSQAGVGLCHMLDAVRIAAAHFAERPEAHEPCSVALLEARVYIQAGVVGAATGAAFLVACFTIHLTGKRAMMVGGFVVGGAAGVALFWARTDATVLALSALYVALVGVCHTVSIAVVVELFPTQLRNMAVSLTLMAGQLGTVVGNVLFPVLLEANCVLVFFLLGTIALGCAGLCFLLPKTKNLELSQ